MWLLSSFTIYDRWAAGGRVATGANSKNVEHGVNGFLAESQEDCEQALRSAA